eukprot:TRINITY_DN32898_c0_g3_i1.p1 TRINITY_DN32898_c0_g3~~TRINITY_DN32898_c0_g3_i1.p1  ORF type:complete len:719 (+),score=187.85 TRINITY_DN32898_c0_g3_i1:80-2236(+)
MRLGPAAAALRKSWAACRAARRSAAAAAAEAAADAERIGAALELMEDLDPPSGPEGGRALRGTARRGGGAAEAAEAPGAAGAEAGLDVGDVLSGPARRRKAGAHAELQGLREGPLLAAVPRLESDAPVEELMNGLISEQQPGAAVALYERLRKDSGSWCHLRQGERPLLFRLPTLNAVLRALVDRDEVPHTTDVFLANNVVKRMDREGAELGLTPDGETYAALLAVMAKPNSRATPMQARSVLAWCEKQRIRLPPRAYLSVLLLLNRWQVSAGRLWYSVRAREVPLWPQLADHFIRAAALAGTPHLATEVLGLCRQQSVKPPEAALVKAVQLCAARPGGSEEEVRCVIDVAQTCAAAIPQHAGEELVVHAALRLRSTSAAQAALALCPEPDTLPLRGLLCAAALGRPPPDGGPDQGAAECARLLLELAPQLPADALPDPLGGDGEDSPAAAADWQEGLCRILGEPPERAAAFAAALEQAVPEDGVVPPQALAVAVRALAAADTPDGEGAALELLRRRAAPGSQAPHLGLLRGLRARRERAAAAPAGVLRVGGAGRGDGLQQDEVLRLLEQGGAQPSLPLLHECALACCAADELDRALQHLAAARRLTGGQFTAPPQLWHALLLKACAVCDGRLVRALCGELETQSPPVRIPKALAAQCEAALRRWDWRGAVTAELAEWLAKRSGARSGSARSRGDAGRAEGRGRRKPAEGRREGGRKR